jgi:hypothetical protein
MLKRPFIKFMLPLSFILGVSCIIFIIYSNAQNNQFFLTVFANDRQTWSKINTNMKITPLGIFTIDGEANTSNTFRIEGNNIKSVSFESPDSYFVDYAAVRRTPDRETKLEMVSHLPGSILVVEEYISEAMVHWEPSKLIGSKLYGDYGGDYTKYLTDTFTVTVIFTDGQIMTQIMEITVDETTGKTFVQRISVK